MTYQFVEVTPKTGLDFSGTGVRAHRTALFLDMTATSAKGYIGDRVKRLLESFYPSGNGMMVDTYLVGYRTVVRLPEGETYVSSLLTQSEDHAFPVGVLNQWAAEQGYQTVLFLSPAGYELG